MQLRPQERRRNVCNLMSTAKIYSCDFNTLSKLIDLFTQFNDVATKSLIHFCHLYHLTP